MADAKKPEIDLSAWDDPISTPAEIDLSAWDAPAPTQPPLWQGGSGFPQLAGAPAMPSGGDYGGALDALLKGANYGLGITSTAAADLARRLVPGGKSGVTREDIQRAAEGRARPLQEFVRESGVDLNPLEGMTLDLVGGAALDPASWAGQLKKLPGIGKEIGAVRELVTPISKGIKRLGRKVSGTPYTSSDVALEGMKHAYPAKSFSDYLWNSGKPRFKPGIKTPMEYHRDIGRIKSEAYAPLAKFFNANKDEVLQVSPEFNKTISEYRIKLLGPNPTKKQLFEALMGDHAEWLKRRIASGDNPADFEVLSNAAPEFAGAIGEIGQTMRLDANNVPGARTLGLNLIDDISRAPQRKFADVKRAYTSASNRAKGGANVSSHGGMQGVASESEQKIALKIAEGWKGIEAANAKRLGMDPKLYERVSRTYSMLQSASPTFRKEMVKSAKRPGMSKLDQYLLATMATGWAVDAGVGGGGMVGGAATAPFLWSKLTQELRGRPNFAKNVGLLLDKIGNSDVLDTLIRRAAIEVNE